MVITPLCSRRRRVSRRNILRCLLRRETRRLLLVRCKVTLLLLFGQTKTKNKPCERHERRRKLYIFIKYPNCDGVCHYFCTFAQLTNVNARQEMF